MTTYFHHHQRYKTDKMSSCFLGHNVQKFLECVMQDLSNHLTCSTTYIAHIAVHITLHT